MIYTSYFVKFRNFPENVTPVSIALYSPKWYSGKTYLKLAPTKHILTSWMYSKEYDAEKYTKDYTRDILEKLDPFTVYSELLQLGDKFGNDICLLCYEKPGDFCHRNLVAEWLRKNGFPCQEYIY